MTDRFDEPPPPPDEGGGSQLDRTPPQDVLAEQSVLGAMMMSKDAIADVVEIVRGRDFYLPKHEFVYDAILSVYGRGDPADAITVADELGRTGQLQRVGGAPYLHDLLSSVAIAANASYYAEIVRDKAILRRLVEASVQIAQMGYAGEGEVNDIVDAAQAAVYGVSDGKANEDYAPLADLMEETLDEIEAISAQGGEMVGVPTGFTDLDELTNGLHPGQMVILAARPAMGKSTLGLDMARSCSIKNNMASVIFSLEMSKVEIVMRLVSAEAQIQLSSLRKGSMNEDDWQRLANKMADISSAPLFIDDSPNLTMMEIRAKARRLKQKHDLRLIVIDYLQLMTSGKKVESRQLEVSEFSRQIKLLAKELGVPVVAMSQLNRGPEQRTDKKPMVSDLRESGCLTASTRILRADTGAETTIGEIYSQGLRDIPVWSVDENHRVVPMTMTHAFSSGVKDVFRMRLASGREIEATANHKFLTIDGWVPLEDLAPGHRLAVPRHVPDPIATKRADDDEVALLAHMIGDGSFVKKQPIRYASVDEANLTRVAEAASRRFGINAKRDEHSAARVTTLRLPAPFRLTHGKRNPIAAWLDGLGLFGLRSHEKFIPEWVFALPLDQVQDFIGHLWATDGSARWDEQARQARIYYATSSRRLADGLCQLLLRCGIVARIKIAQKSGFRDGYHVHIYGAAQQLTFCRTIPVWGARGVSARQMVPRLEAIKGNTNVDTVPREVWASVRTSLTAQGMSHRAFSEALGTAFCGSALWKRSPSRERLGRVATLLEDPDLQKLADSDLLWDSVVSIEPLGQQEVFDATVPGTHCFVANGVVAHNSLEQDADIVILLHRDDVYDKESPRAGEADFIIAKNRNGPTRTVTTIFQGHYSRFVDMQH
ncbi:replicative DNA helicase [Propioniferax innocua]|uniref:Replicative DNA helicase n=1 Tax=Propioniferax innocua TaxID=1753 RepID=A0A542ZSX9_9ACTN|nr:replicative DNA helicase [Propioniferax innocua]TQL63464.1 primary replicative DNA helicase /intein [Propioniferax innocua]